MVSQRDLALQFAAGAESGSASNVRIREVSGGYTLLVGYGHAVYAARSPGGMIVGYRGWHGYSPATSTQLTKMGITHPDDTLADSEQYEKRCIVDHWVDRAPEITEWEIKGLREIL